MEGTPRRKCQVKRNVSRGEVSCLKITFQTEWIRFGCPISDVSHIENNSKLEYHNTRRREMKKWGSTPLQEHGFGGGKGGFYYVRRRRALNNLLKSLGKSYKKSCFLLTSEPFRYLAERSNPFHGNLCDNPLPLSTTRFPKSFIQAFFARWGHKSNF
ncbi:hypothetical protein AVEN_176066-1 [Araneus ventricosus]|uniref:Uncharacterized protein n=1 Tax=Araneus ventricosus TaxID=182803 RepID=A0A4Y2F5C9_ARAVE|nr:hypothetical protein AVEN_176066-1 [Araneus ventricosus]